MALRMKFEGIDKYTKMLLDLEKPATRRAVFSSAMRRGLSPIRSEAKKNAKAIKLRGNLARALKSKVKIYARTGTVFGAVGAERKKLADGRNPGNYSHLVEFGTRQHHKFSRRRSYKATGPPVRWVYFNERIQQWRSLRNGIHPGARARPFLKPAAFSAKSKAAAEFAKKFVEVYRRKLDAGS